MPKRRHRRSRNRRGCGDGLREYIAAAEAALADDGDAFKVFRRFMTRVVEADAHTLTASLTRSLEASSEAVFRDATKAQDLGERVFKRAQKGGAVRADAVAEDMTNVFEQLAAIRGPSPKRTVELRKRYRIQIPEDDYLELASMNSTVKYLEPMMRDMQKA